MHQAAQYRIVETAQADIGLEAAYELLDEDVNGALRT